MLCRQRNGHQRLNFPIQIVKEVRGDRQTIIRLSCYINGESFLARFAVFCCEKFDLVQIPTEVLEAQTAFGPVDPRLVGASLCTPPPFS